MKKVKLESLRLVNFKKITDLVIDFQDKTQITGRNAAGKSTIADAYLWLLYGKNQQDETDFSIKTLDSSNKAIPKLDHEVEGVFVVDLQRIVFKKVYREKWVTKRGNDFEELTGHETTYFVNDVPVSLSEYKNRVSEMIPENISKILSNPLYFNTKLKWNERREILSQMAGSISDDEILINANLNEVSKMLSEGKNIEDQKKIISVQKKKIKDEIELIPSRIDESNRSKPEAQNWAELESKINSNNAEIEKLQNEIMNLNEAANSEIDQYMAKKGEKASLERLLNDLKEKQSREALTAIQDNKNRLNDLNNRLKNDKEQIEYFKGIIQRNEKSISALKESNSILKAKYEEWTAKEFVFDPNENICPACKRPMENAQDHETEMRESFNRKKLESINQIKASATDNNREIEKLEESNNDTLLRIKGIEDKIDEYKKEVLNIESQPTPTISNEPTEEMIALQQKIEGFVVEEIKRPDLSVQKAKIDELNSENNLFRTALNNKSFIEKIDSRIDELKQQQKTLSQELSQLDKLEFEIEQFNKLKIEQVEQKTNSLFSIVKFKMFETQLNGGESPACVCTVNGVPFSDLNTAMKINASLDIINALQYYFDISVPVFIDQKESVSDLLDISSQIIALKVDENAEKLTISAL